MLLQGQQVHASSMICWGLCASFGALGFGVFATMPGPSSNSRAATLMPLGRGVIALDGLAGLALAWSIIVGAAREETLGTFASMLTGLPMAAWAVGLILCQSDAELVVAAPTVMIFAIGAGMKA